MASLTIKQQTNYNGFPKAAELIEIQGAHALEASDRALMNTLLQHAHDSGRLTEPDAEWELRDPLIFSVLYQAVSHPRSGDRAESVAAKAVPTRSSRAVERVRSGRASHGRRRTGGRQYRMRGSLRCKRAIQENRM